MAIRNRIYRIIEPAAEGDKYSRLYDISMIIIIVLSLVPLAFKQATGLFNFIDYTCVTIFIIDYAMRLGTADLKLHRGAVSFLIYPFTLWGVSLIY